MARAATDEPAELEFALRAQGAYRVDALFTPPDGPQATLARDEPVSLDLAALVAHMPDPVAYGRALAAQLFAGQALATALAQARAYAHGAGCPLRVRLRLDHADPALCALRWETLCDSPAGNPLALNEAVRLVRSLDSVSLAPAPTPERRDLSAVVAVAAPPGLSAYGLAPIDAEAEVALARHALGSIPAVVLGRAKGAAAPLATLDAIAAALRAGPALLYLVCHGALLDGASYLWLENAAGGAERVPADDLALAIEGLARRPLLVILAACESGAASAAAAPRLAQVGVPAVIGMQGPLRQDDARHSLLALLSELGRDGQVDRALAVARFTLRQRGAWWLPALWLRGRAGGLWRAAPATAPAPGAPRFADQAHRAADQAARRAAGPQAARRAEEAQRQGARGARGPSPARRGAAQGGRISRRKRAADQAHRRPGRGRA